MKLCFFLSGLPGSAYHGGAVTCWAILKEMKKLEIDVEVLSLYDESVYNPYLQYRIDQENEIKSLGVPIHYINCKWNEISGLKSKIELIQKVNRISFVLPWAKLAPQVELFFQQNIYDAIFCYHFEPLAAIRLMDNKPACKIIAGLGDLLFEPYYYRLKYEKQYGSFLTRLKKWASFYLLKKIQIETMKEVTSFLSETGFFAAHYADWFARKTKKKIHYFRTPTHDPSGNEWELLREQKRSKKFKILFIGELNTTVASIGIDEFAAITIPLLESKLPEGSFEIHFVGGGNPPDTLKQHLNKPFIKLRGRVYPPDDEFLSCNVLVVPTPIKLGIRVRIITAFSFGTCVVAHVANKAGIPELVNDENCILMDNPVMMAESIIEVFQNIHKQKQIENSAKRTFQRHFSEQTAANEIIRKITMI